MDMARGNVIWGRNWGMARGVRNLGLLDTVRGFRLVIRSGQDTVE